VLAQPKRLALLTYIAIAGKDNRRKDILVAIFWPELDQQHGRAALRNSLYFLRTALDPEIVVARGEEVWVDRSRLWCDAAAYDVAAETGDQGAMLQLDRGDLLEGVHVSDSRPFDEWVEAQRVRRRFTTQEAAISEARRHAGAGRLDDALGCARRAKSLSPLNEEIVRAVMALQYLAGDVAGALDEHHRFEALLSTELDATPAYETQQFVEALRNPRSVSAAVDVALAQLRRLRMDAPRRPQRTSSPGSAPNRQSPSAVPAPAVGVKTHELVDQHMLKALLDLRLGLARHGGGRVGIIRVTVPKCATSVKLESEQPGAVIHELASAIVSCIRNGDHVAVLDDGTLMVLPGDGSPAVMASLASRFRKQVEEWHQALGPRPESMVVPEVSATWIDPRSPGDPLASLGFA